MHGGQQLVGIIAPSAGRALAAPIVLVAELSQSLISGPPVGDDRRARLDVIHHERVQGLGRGIGQWRHAAPPQSSRLMNLNCDTGQHLLAPSAATGQPRLGAADVGLGHLYRPAQQIPTGTYQHRPQAVQHGPGSLVGADLQYSLQAQRRDPVFTGGEQPAGGVPYRQGCPRPIEDRTGRHRTACRTRRTHEAAIAQAPTAFVAATRTDEAVGPPQPFEVVQAVRIGSKPGLKLANRARVVLASARIRHALNIW